jgi:hypothetical protein
MPNKKFLNLSGLNHGEMVRTQNTHPWNQTLEETSDTSTRPDGSAGLHHRLRSVGSHLGLQNLQRLPERRDLHNGYVVINANLAACSRTTCLL